MDRLTLIKKLSEILDAAEKARLWGSVEIQFAHGKPTVLRENSTTKLDGGNTRDLRVETR
jgi:hypothetical protein